MRGRFPRVSPCLLLIHPDARPFSFVKPSPGFATRSPQKAPLRPLPSRPLDPLPVTRSFFSWSICACLPHTEGIRPHSGHECPGAAVAALRAASPGVRPFAASSAPCMAPCEHLSLVDILWSMRPQHLPSLFGKGNRLYHRRSNIFWCSCQAVPSPPPPPPPPHTPSPSPPPIPLSYHLGACPSWPLVSLDLTPKRSRLFVADPCLSSDISMASCMARSPQVSPCLSTTLIFPCTSVLIEGSLPEAFRAWPRPIRPGCARAQHPDPSRDGQVVASRLISDSCFLAVLLSACKAVNP